MNDSRKLTRRGSLAALGGLAAAAAGVGAWRATARDDPGTAASETEAAADGPAAVTTGAVACVLSPELTEGPFYVADEAVRSDITEDRDGAPLALLLTVLDASTCRPVEGAAVDVWHCDAAGAYSGVGDAAGETFLRGVQRTDADGLARFATVYPGWYPGRAVHIHLKVHVGGSVVHTGQLFFDDALTEQVYAEAPYAGRGGPDVPNEGDAIYRNGGARSTLAVERDGDGWAGTINLGVQRT